jgi:AcrR family transcriptional regulator
LEEQRLNDIFQRRAALIEAANRLYDVGAINFSDKEARIKAAYESTNEAITTQLQLLQQYLEANRNLFPPEIYERALAGLQAYNAELQYTGTMLTAVKQSAEQAIAGGIMNMFDSLAQGIANIITGAGSLKDLFSDLGRAALDFAAQFLQAIAQAIMQIYALRIAKSLVGGFHGGGTVGDYGGGQMKLSRNIGMPDLSGVPRYHNGPQGAGLGRATVRRAGLPAYPQPAHHLP